MYFITGFFIQEKPNLEIGYDNGEERAIVNTADHVFCFHGCFNSDTGEGQINDCFGESTLSQVQLAGDILRFTKYYTHSPDRPITYYFQNKSNDGWWDGNYLWKGGTSGFTRCVLTEVKPGYFTEDIVLIEHRQDDGL